MLDRSTTCGQLKYFSSVGFSTTDDYIIFEKRKKEVHLLWIYGEIRGKGRFISASCISFPFFQILCTFHSVSNFHSNFSFIHFGVKRNKNSKLEIKAKRFEKLLSDVSN